MKGVLFNVVEDVVTEALSADAWDDVVDAAGVSGSYTSLGTYPDEELVAIVAAVSQTAGLTIDETLRLAGRLGFKHLARRNTQLLAGLDDWQGVVASLDDIIHPEVRKIYPDADVPGFDATPIDDGYSVTYRSERGLCSLAEGLLLGAAEWFGHTVTVEQVSCRHRGDADCTMTVREDLGGGA